MVGPQLVCKVAMRAQTCGASLEKTVMQASSQVKVTWPSAARASNTAASVRVSRVPMERASW